MLCYYGNAAQNRFIKNVIFVTCMARLFRRKIVLTAVILSGGKQYKVKAGDLVTVEKLSASAGDEVSLDVLMTSGEGGVKIGTPLVEGAAVKAEVVKHYKGDKLTIFTYKPKKNIRKKQGHRQPYTLVKIKSVE